MSHLSDAIADLGTDDFMVPHDLDDRYGSWLEVTDAARRVVDGVHIRYCAWHESRVAFGATRCQVADDHACAPGDYLLILVDPPDSA